MNTEAKLAEPTNKSSEAPKQKRADVPGRSPADARSLAWSPCDARRAGNMAVQRLRGPGQIQTKLAVGSSGDIYEREADRVAEQVRTGAPAGAIQKKCACGGGGEECEACRGGGTTIQRRASGVGAPSEAPAVVGSVLGSGGGRPLDSASRAFMESRFGHDFGGVRVHADARAAESARAVGARAYTHGQDVVFAEGEYAPEGAEGQRLLAHELTHVVQQGGTSDPSGTRQAQENTEVRRSPLDSSAAEEGHDTEHESEDARAEKTVTRAPSQEQLQREGGEATDEEVAAFKQLVLTVARARLASNRVNLAKWRILVEDIRVEDPQQRLALQVAQLQSTAQHHGSMEETALGRGLATENPITRVLELGHVEGRYTACTGCHLAVAASQLENETPELERMGEEWRPLADRLTGIDSRDRGHVSAWMMNYPMPDLSGGALRPAASDADRIRAWLNEDTGAARAPTAAAPAHAAASHEQAPVTSKPQAPGADQMERINSLTAPYRPIVEALGPNGYRVWNDSYVNWDSADPESVRQDILSHIDQRISDYLELMGMIAAGERDYKEFVPILQDLLPTTTPGVRDVINAEIEDEADKNFLEAIVVGLATLATLLLIIFPPTTALGVAALSALEVGLGTYSVVKGAEMMDQGYAFSLGEGADDVYTREQQQSGGTMMLFGFISIVTGPLMAGTGALRGLGALRGMAEGGMLAEMTASEALTEGSAAVFGAEEATALGPGTVQQGKLILSYEADGTVVGIVEGEPNVIMIARDGEAVLYERTAEGGLRLVAREPLPPGGAGPGGGPGVPYESPWPHVEQADPIWCGAACGEMAAKRLGVEVSQGELAATEHFSQPLVADGRVIMEGGFQTPELGAALEEVAPVAGRVWRGGTIPSRLDMTAAGIQKTLNGYLRSTNSSIILRVQGAKHWIVVDEITADGLIAIRDPARQMSMALTAEELAAMGPTGDAVFSFPK